MTKALVVVSGGMDSITLLEQVMSYNQWEVFAVSFDYGQKHLIELRYAGDYCESIDVPHFILKLPVWSSHTALTDKDHAVPEGHYAQETMKQTVVPNRNSIMLNLAVGLAMDLMASAVFTGVHAGDHAVYPDCRPDFINSLNDLIYVANEGFHPPVILAPFIHMTKREIAQAGTELGVAYEKTWSCYKGGIRAHDGNTDNLRSIHCGRCSTCVERLEALDGLPDKTEYADKDYWRTVTNG